MLRSSTTGQGVTGKAAAEFSGNYNINGAAAVSLSFSAGTAGDSYSSGKIAELGLGKYAWHVPDALFATAGSVSAVLSCDDAIDVHWDWTVAAANRGTAAFGANTTTPPTASAVADEVQTRTIARVTLVDTVTTNTDMRGTDGANTVVPPTVAQFEARTLLAADYFVVGDYTAPPAAATIATATRSELATELGFLDAAISTRSTHDAAAVVTSLGTGSTLTACLTATGFSTHSASDVLISLGTGTWATEIPWNASWDAEVQSKVNDALVALDLDSALIAQGAERAVSVDNSHRVHSHVYDMQANTLTALAIAADAVAEIQSGLAKTGADGDTLKTLSDQIDGIAGGAGSGARTVTVTINDGTDTLQNATVRMTEGVNTYTAMTNASGVAVFNLDDATYTVGISKSGYTFAGASLVVDGTEVVTYSMTQVVVSPPDAASASTGVAIVYDENEQPEPSVPVYFRKYVTGGPGTAGYIEDYAVKTLTSDVNGNIEGEFRRLWTYEVWRGDGSIKRRFTVPDASSFSIAEALGADV